MGFEKAGIDPSDTKKIESVQAETADLSAKGVELDVQTKARKAREVAPDSIPFHRSKITELTVGLENAKGVFEGAQLKLIGGSAPRLEGTLPDGRAVKLSMPEYSRGHAAGMIDGREVPTEEADRVWKENVSLAITDEIVDKVQRELRNTEGKLERSQFNALMEGQETEAELEHAPGLVRGTVMVAGEKLLLEVRFTARGTPLPDGQAVRRDSYYAKLGHIEASSEEAKKLWERFKKS